MTLPDIANKLSELTDQWSFDPDEFMGSESEYQYAIGKSDAFSVAYGMVMAYLEDNSQQWIAEETK
jgi:hypothetical protein